jgi:hypothetical protein
VLWGQTTLGKEDFQKQKKPQGATADPTGWPPPSPVPMRPTTTTRTVDTTTRPPDRRHCLSNQCNTHTHREREGGRTRIRPPPLDPPPPSTRIRPPPLDLAAAHQNHTGEELQEAAPGKKP